MSTDDRSESLAAQAAAWVPPWERPAAPAAGDGEAGEAPAGGPLPGESAADVAPPVGTGLPDRDVRIEPGIPIPQPLSAPAPSGTDDSVPVVSAPPLRDAVADFQAASRSGVADFQAALRSGVVDLPAADSTTPTDPTQPTPAAPITAAAGGGESLAAVDGEASAHTTAAMAAVTGQHEVDRAAGSPAGAVDEPAAPRTPALPEPATGGAGDAAVAADPARVVDDHELRAALEAILLVVDEPVAEMVLAQILEQPTERVAAMLETVSAGYTAAGHGFDLRRAAGGWRLYTRPEYAAYVERFVLDGQSLRLTQAALEALAVIAYKQPVSRSRISAIRGVNCDGVMRTLVSRGLVEECGTDPESGAFLYRTTVLFLEKLGLNSVDQLPPLAPFLPDDVEEVLDAQR